MIPDSKRFAFSHSPGNVLILPFGEIVNDDDISGGVILLVSQEFPQNKRHFDVSKLRSKLFPLIFVRVIAAVLLDFLNAQ